MAVEDFKVYTQDSGWVSLAQTLPQGTSEGQLLHWDGTQWAAASDGTTDGQYLIWDDTAKRWEPGTHETGNLPIQSDDGTVVLDSPVQRLLLISNGTPGAYGFVFNTGTGHFGSGIKGSYTPGSATVTFRNRLENNASNTTILRLDSPVFGNSGAAVTKFGSTCYPDNRGDNVSFIGYDFGTFYESSLYPSDPSKEFVNATGYRAADVFRNATGTVIGFLSQVSADGNSKNTETYQFYAEGLAPSRFNGEVQTSTVKGLVGTDAQIDLGSQAELKNGDGSEYVPVWSTSIATKKYVDEAVDDVIWIGTQAEYDALGLYDNKRLYCITD